MNIQAGIFRVFEQTKKLSSSDGLCEVSKINFKNIVNVTYIFNGFAVLSELHATSVTQCLSGRWYSLQMRQYVCTCPRKKAMQQGCHQTE